MTDEIILMASIIGKVITDIQCKYGQQDGWLDTAECFIELDHTLFIEIPYGESAGVFESVADQASQSIFSDLSDIPQYSLNREGKVTGVEYRVNSLKHVINRTIVDYWWESDRTEKGFFELDNGYFISEQYMAPSGTGLAGLHLYDSLDSLKKMKGDHLRPFSANPLGGT
jgi:hypothetical protein